MTITFTQFIVWIVKLEGVPLISTIIAAVILVIIWSSLSYRRT